MAYQKYVLEHCGVKVTGTYLIQINGDYVLHGALELDRFFVVTDVSAVIGIESRNIEANLSIAERLLASDTEPDIDLSEACQKPYPCSFWPYCARHVPQPSVFDLYRLPFKKKIEYYRRGLAEYRDLIYNSGITNEKQLRQMEYAIEDKGTYVDKDGVQEFLDTLSYPLYFLDFETMQPVIPRFEGSRPYQQITFQYSLHYIEREGGELKHREFLAESGPDPRRALAEQLCADIPMNVCVTA